MSAPSRLPLYLPMSKSVKLKTLTAFKQATATKGSRK